jgi:hypothetical protein
MKILRLLKPSNPTCRIELVQEELNPKMMPRTDCILMKVEKLWLSAHLTQYPER